MPRHGVSPWARLLASPAIAPEATGKIQVATLTCPILGRAIGPITPHPPLEVPVAARVADPIIVLRLPSCHPRCVPQMHHCVKRKFIESQATQAQLDPLIPHVKPIRIGAR